MIFREVDDQRLMWNLETFFQMLFVTIMNKNKEGSSSVYQCQNSRTLYNIHITHDAQTLVLVTDLHPPSTKDQLSPNINSHH